ncbi:MAG: hypothetical protein K6D97_02195 [Clostridia bacterium]|nr:hypothetical protein [Clostridia bacterium]
MTVDEIKTKFGDAVFCDAVMMTTSSTIKVTHGGFVYHIVRGILPWDYFVKKVKAVSAS